MTSVCFGGLQMLQVKRLRWFGELGEQVDGSQLWHPVRIGGWIDDDGLGGFGLGTGTAGKFAPANERGTACIVFRPSVSVRLYRLGTLRALRPCWNALGPAPSPRLGLPVTLSSIDARNPAFCHWRSKGDRAGNVARTGPFVAPRLSGLSLRLPGRAERAVWGGGSANFAWNLPNLTPRSDE